MQALEGLGRLCLAVYFKNVNPFNNRQACSSRSVIGLKKSKRTHKSNEEIVTLMIEQFGLPRSIPKMTHLSDPGLFPMRDHNLPP